MGFFEFADPAALARGLTLKGWHVDVDPVSLL